MPRVCAAFLCADSIFRKNLTYIFISRKYVGGIILKDIAMKRAAILGKYIVEHNATVRDAAKAYRISKSTVHKDVTERLSEFAPSLAAQVKAVLEKNKSERHMRGGEATKRKYIELKMEKETREYTNV